MIKRYALILLVLNAIVVGCTGGDEGMLTDEQKLEKASQGRADYGKSMQEGGAGQAGAPTSGN